MGLQYEMSSLRIGHFCLMHKRRIHYLIICEGTIKASFEVKEHIRLLYRGHACKLMYIHMREVNHPLYKGAIHV